MRSIYEQVPDSFLICLKKMNVIRPVIMAHWVTLCSGADALPVERGQYTWIIDIIGLWVDDGEPDALHFSPVADFNCHNLMLSSYQMEPNYSICKKCIGIHCRQAGQFIVLRALLLRSIFLPRDILGLIYAHLIWVYLPFFR